MVPDPSPLIGKLNQIESQSAIDEQKAPIGWSAPFRSPSATKKAESICLFSQAVRVRVTVQLFFFNASLIQLHLQLGKV